MKPFQVVLCLSEVKGMEVNMNEITLKRLKEAGWNNDRKIDISDIKLKYKKIGLEMPINISVFLEEFGFLKIDPPDKKYFDVEFNPIEAIGINLTAEYFEECLKDYGINEKVFPIGMAREDNLFVLMTEKNTVFVFTDGCLGKAGSSVEEMLDCLVGECFLPEDIVY